VSAWARLVAKAGPGDLEELSAALEEVQRETSRRNAARIRRSNPDRCPDFADGAEWAADLIDPEVP
jgi:hypothetical protein